MTMPIVTGGYFFVNLNWTVLGLKRELRKAVRLAGEPIGGVDIACAQPGLLGVLIRLVEAGNVPTYIQRIHPAHLRRLTSLLPDSLDGLRGLLEKNSPHFGPDLCRFESAASRGGLYYDLITLCDAGGVVLPEDPLVAKEQVKLLLVRDVLAKRGHYPSPFETVFRRAFPTVYGFVRRVNRTDHGELIRALQCVESWLVIENVAPRLVARGIPIVTLHDAIYSRVGDVPAVVDAFEETFKELGLRLKLKPERTAPRIAGRTKSVEVLQ
jgi:hypothetical protein